MAEIVFFNPPRSRRGADHVLDTAMLWLASSLRQAGVGAVVRMPAGDALERDVAAAIEAERPRWVAIACKWWNTLYGALQVAAAVRAAAPRLPIVLGGHTASVFPRELIATGLADVVLMGDADSSLPELVCDGRISNGYSATGYHPAAAPGARQWPALDEVTLHAVDALVDRPELVPGYVWIGRGCSFDCFYCLENRKSGRQYLGRAHPRLRAPEAVARDIGALGGRSQLVLDWEHPATAQTERFIAAVAQAAAGQMSSCYYFDWGLPSRALLDTLSSGFSQVSICLDVQVFHEPHRRRLSEQRLIKPFFTDRQLLELLDDVERRDNVEVDATGLVGMPFEDDQAREAALRFIERVSADYRCVRDWRVSPLHVIPGTALAQGDRFHDLEVVRRSFGDFLAFTRDSFEQATPYYSSERAAHPYGVYPAGSPLAIVRFMEQATARLDAVRHARRRLDVTRESDGVHVRIDDSFSPLRTLFDAIGGVPGGDIATPLHLSIGSRTLFLGSWVDYTSESGENSATRCNLEPRPEKLRARLHRCFDRFADVRLAPASGRWGVIADEWDAWRLGRASAPPNRVRP